MSIENVKGKEATIHFDASKCIHSRHCVLSHPDVFVPNVKGEWIYPDAQPIAELMHIAKNCPSGAITVTRNNKTTDNSNAAPMVNTVRVRENGPLAIEADLQIKGEMQSNPRATLCRCGQSRNKPFCDGSHVTAGFSASGEPSDIPFEPLVSRNGIVNIEPIPNGPLKAVGNLEIVSGTGRTCNKVTETHLCRCGHSKNKPYCDGSHRAVGFLAE